MVENNETQYEEMQFLSNLKEIQDEYIKSSKNLEDLNRNSSGKSEEKSLKNKEINIKNSKINNLRNSIGKILLFDSNEPTEEKRSLRNSIGKPEK